MGNPYPTHPVSSPGNNNNSTIIIANSYLWSAHYVPSTLCMCSRGGLLKLGLWGQTAVCLSPGGDACCCFPGASYSTTLASVSSSVKWV